MRLNLSIAAVVLCASLAGCGPSAEVTGLKEKIAEIEGNLDSKRIELQSKTPVVSTQTNQCEASRAQDTARIAERKDTITDILDDVVQTGSDDRAAAGQKWTIAVQELSGENWSWREEQTIVAVEASGNVGLIIEDLTYSVDPRNLAPKVEVGENFGLPAVRVRCKDGTKCIKVKGQRQIGRGNAYDRSRDTRTSDVSEMRAENWWMVSTAPESGRLSMATNDLITLQAGNTSSSCEASEKGKAEVSALETEIANLEKTLEEAKRDLRRLEE